MSEVALDSISLYLEDAPIFKGFLLSSVLKNEFSQYRPYSVAKEEERLAPSLWHLPEVFRKKLTAFAEHQMNEISEQDRIAGIVRYNFNNGLQVSAKEILRHPWHRLVPRDLLPQPETARSVFYHWPLTGQKDHLFVSQSLKQVDDIIQALLAAVTIQLSQKKIQVFLQTKHQPGLALEVKKIDYDPSPEMDWRVEFSNKTPLESEFKLISARKQTYLFFDSYALDPRDGQIIVHPWAREWNRIREHLPMDAVTRQKIEIEYDFTISKMPTIRFEGESKTKIFLKYLRSRNLPVKITGETVVIPKNKSQVEIYLLENGEFYFHHSARILSQIDLQRPGWSSQTAEILKILSEGLPYFLKAEPKDLMARSGRKREWDMKILRHLGIIQYVFLEFLSLHFEGHLTDGRVVDFPEIVSSVENKIRDLLAGASDVVSERDLPLPDLISKNIINYLNEFIVHSQGLLELSESYYFEHGEVILEGVVEKEFLLLYELLKDLALSSAGEAFRRLKSSFLSKIWDGDLEQTPELAGQNFHLPSWKKDRVQVHQTLEILHPLIAKDFKILYKGQSLLELDEDQFAVDFSIRTDSPSNSFNWFELNPRFFLLGQEIDPNNMKSFGSGGIIEYDGKMYLVPRKQMPSLRRLENFWLKLQKGKKDSGFKSKNEKFYQLPRHQVLELLALRSAGYPIRGDSEWNKLCEFYDQLGQQPRDHVTPQSLKAELKPYQKKGVQWMSDLYRLKLGALLADDMGLGKTLQTLGFLEDLRLKKEMGQVLVVVPSSLIYNWQSEIEKFTPELPVTVFTNRERKKISERLLEKEDLIVIVTYGLLMEHEAYFCEFQWKVLVFDEAQNLKNITTKRTSAARSLKGQFKVCLTGTPMENHYGEFYSLVDLIVPGSLGPIDDFKRQFVNSDSVSKAEIEDLKLKIKPLMLRRSKKEILDQLPEKQETKVSIAFEERQKEIYRDIALSYNQKVQETMATEREASVQLQMLTALLRLRQACSDPAALPQVKYDKVPPKLEALRDSILEIVESGESALVFTQFLQTLDHTIKILKEENIPVYALHGGVPSKQRQKILTDFNQNPKGAVLVMTLKTGGVGLNLTKASYVFHLEPWWNPAVENQATDRAHRLGQSKAVQVFKYIMHESLEEKIEILKSRKDKKFQSLFESPEKESDLSLGDSGSGGSGLSKDDFDMLLGLK